MIRESNFSIVKTCVSNDFIMDTQSYVKVSEHRYPSAKKDFTLLPQFAAIEQLSFENSVSNVVFVSADDLDTTLLAANYIGKKMAEEDKLLQWPDYKNGYRVDLFGEPSAEDLALYEELLKVASGEGADEFDDEAYFADEDELDVAVKLAPYEFPVLEADDFLRRYVKLGNGGFFGEYVQDEECILYKKPIRTWFSECPTLFVIVDEFHLDAWTKALSVCTQNVILIAKDAKKAAAIYEQLLYIDDIVHLKLTTVDKSYLKKLFVQTVAASNVKVMRSFDFEAMLTALASFKKNKLNVIQDTLYIANRFANYARKAGKPISNQLVEQLLHVQKTSNTLEEIQQLIGLARPKEALAKITAKIKFNAQRKAENLPVVDNHFVLAFVGNPGTAKTTFAKLMGQYLVEQKLLTSSAFKVATRKDLIAEYVGHTAPKVEQLFREVKGGVLFIDEAYSLYEGKRGTVFADEALAELVVQIEENPDTLVIFAGYTAEMGTFMDEANAGLKSRISHKIHFEDYGLEDMCDIYLSFVKKHAFTVDSVKTHKEQLQAFLMKYPKQQLQKEGNGRLMRKVFQRAVEEKIHHQAQDAIITAQHLNNALTSLFHELQPSKSEPKKIVGFHFEK